MPALGLSAFQPSCACVCVCVPLVHAPCYCVGHPSCHGNEEASGHLATQMQSTARPQLTHTTLACQLDRARKSKGERERQREGARVALTKFGGLIGLNIVLFIGFSSGNHDQLRIYSGTHTLTLSSTHIVWQLVRLPGWKIEIAKVPSSC